MSKQSAKIRYSSQAIQVVVSAIAATLIASACGTIPTNGGPTVGVLPGGGKNMVEFNKDDIACRDNAQARAKDNTPLPMAMGLGSIEVASARPRAVVRDRTEDTLSTGSVFGNAPAADPALITKQQRYDTAYVQCMYSKGHKIPVGEAMSS